MRHHDDCSSRTGWRPAGVWRKPPQGSSHGSSVAGGATQAFLWQNGVMTALGTLGGGSSYAYSINNLSQVDALLLFTVEGGAALAVICWTEFSNWLLVMASVAFGSKAAKV